MRYRPDRDKEIAHLKLELAAIAELKEVIRTRGWRQIVTIIQKFASKLAQDAYDKCENPEKNAMEIRCKKMVADTLGAILLTIDSRVNDEDYIGKQLVEKVEEYNHLQDLQKLETL